MCIRIPVAFKILLVIASMLYMLSCSKELSLQGDPCPYDTIPGDTIPGQYIITGIRIKPDSLTATGITFYIETTTGFPFKFPVLIGGSDNSHNSFNIGASYVAGRNPCPDANVKASCTTRRIPLRVAKFPVTYPLTVMMDTTFYTGTVTLTETAYYFNWTHDNIISIHPEKDHDAKIIMPPPNFLFILHCL